MILFYGVRKCADSNETRRLWATDLKNTISPYIMGHKIADLNISIMILDPSSLRIGIVLYVWSGFMSDYMKKRERVARIDLGL